MLFRDPISTAIFAASIFLVTLSPPAGAQAPTPGAPPVFASPATQSRILGEAEAAFTAKDYATAVAKIKELLSALGPRIEANDPSLEILYFNIGLGELLGDLNAQAEASFKDCLRRFPKGEYASRCQLGIGRACILQDTPEKKLEAIEALKIAAMDPPYRSEAGLWLGQVYTDLGRHEEALRVFRSLMGSDVRSPQQTTAAVEVIGLLAESGKLEDLIAYLDRLSNQAGVRDAIAWYANQVVRQGDELVMAQSYDSALAIYRSVPSRSQILQIQGLALDAMRRDEKLLQATVTAEKDKPINQRSSATELLKALSPAIVLAEAALKAIEEKPDLDAQLVMRRGRCLFYLDRFEEALVCFRTLRTKYASTPDAEHGSYAEIVILNRLKNVTEIKDRCEQFMRKFPESSNMEQVATLAGEVLVQGGDWKEVSSFYRGLETKFPDSPNLERYIFYQAVAFFMEANFKESTPLFTRFLKDFAESEFYETAMYYMAMSNFLSNNYKETLATCREYLTKFPDGRYAGDMHYRLSFIDYNDKEEDQSEKIIRDLGAFLKDHPDDEANGSILCLMGDTYKRMKVKSKDRAKADEEAQANEDAALDCYKRAVATKSLDDIMQYALDSATAILQRRKDWDGIAEMHGAFMKENPDSQLALLSAAMVARMKAREGKGDEAAVMLADAMAMRIANPTAEMVEYLIDELVKTLVPRKKAKDVDIEAIDKQLVDVLNKIIAGKENATTAARIYYARARLAQALKHNDRSDLYLKGIATSNATDPSGLSPALLAVCGDILIQNGDLEGAEAMFKRLRDRYSESNFSDAGPVGLGYVALARNQPEDALKIFDDALEHNPGMSRFKETTLGKLQALVTLDRLEPAQSLALAIIGDKMFRGETAGKAYLLLGEVYRKQAAKVTGIEAVNLLKQAHGTYQRVYIAYQSVPEVCAEAYWQAHEVLKELGEVAMAQDTLKALSLNLKLQNTARFKQAADLVK